MHTGDIRFLVHVHPGSKIDSVGGSHAGALRVHVHARALDGAATEEACQLLARCFHVSRQRVRCVRGQRSRTKLIEIDGDEADLDARLQRLLATPAPH
ncbi:MAG TPA: DUF167 domain-containing protein [Acidimicrobiales bacterium]|nr:DUF167 domain-containing protein [Acidimicrobiales bacterium]